MSTVLQPDLVERDTARFLKQWKPHRIQEKFLRLPSTIFEGFYGGQAAGGKSDVLLMGPIVKGLYKIPQFNGAIFRRTFPELEESLIYKSTTGIGYGPGPSYYDLGGEYDKSKHVWTFYGPIAGQGPGSQRLGTIRFLYSQRESDVLQHDTAEFHYLGIDELTHFTWFQYSYLMHRCRSTIRGVIPIVRTASNPGNVGHTWVFKRFIEPAREGDVLLKAPIVDKASGETRIIKRIFIKAKASDNPYLIKVDPDYIFRLNLLPEAERKAKLEGDWDSFGGQVFTEFRSRHHDGEPDNAVHVIPPFDVPTWWPKMLVLDWGYRAMTYGMVVAISPWRRVYQIAEFIAYGQSVQTWGAEFQRKFKDLKNVVAYVIDPSARKTESNGKTVWEQVIDATGMPWELGDNDRIGGITAIHDFLRWKSRPARFNPATGFAQETFDRIFRLYGTQAAEEYKKLFLADPPEEDLPLYQIFDTCPVMVQTLPMVTYAENKTSGKKVEDYAEFDGDDPIDTLRYCMKRAEAFMAESSDKWDRYKKIDAAIEHFKQSGNYNDLDRTLGKVEQEETPVDGRSFSRGSKRGYLLARTHSKPGGPRRGGGLYSIH